MRGFLPAETTLRLRTAPHGVEVREERDSVLGRVEVVDLTRKSSHDTMELVEMKSEAQL